MEKLNRHTALQFIRCSSRLITSMLGNPVPEEDKGDWYEPCYFEQRLGNNGTPFILQDMGKHGWDLYFICGGNNIDKTIEQFCLITGVTDTPSHEERILDEGYNKELTTPHDPELDTPSDFNE